MRKTWFGLSATAMLLCLPGQSLSKPLFEPTSFRLSISNQRSTLHLYNNEDFVVRWQAQIVRWDLDDNGIDRLEAADTISVAPGSLELAPGSGGTLVIEAEDLRQGELEGAYRIVLTSGPIGNGLVNTTYNYSLPIFIEPKYESFSSLSEVSNSEPGKLKITISNDGNVHQFIERIIVEGRDDNGGNIFESEIRGWYLLPQRKRSYILSLSKDDCPKTTSLVTKVILRGGHEQRKSDAVELICTSETAYTGFERTGSQMTPVPENK